jgi:hypothetical protein
MTVVLWLMLFQGVLGAFDTVYYHEYRARLPAGGLQTRPELLLHGARDIVYAVLFSTLPFVAWHGLLAGALAALIAAEIVITLTDFAIEARTREPTGVQPGERITHGLMAIVYGAMIANLAPVALDWWQQPTAWLAVVHDVSPLLRWTLAAMAVGVFASGIRDFWAALGLPGGDFPWQSR